MRAAREIHAQRAETADEVLVQLDSIATRDSSALAQLERAGARLLAGGSLTPALQAGPHRNQDRAASSSKRTPDSRCQRETRSRLPPASLGHPLWLCPTAFRKFQKANPTYVHPLGS